jgi:hypothetical protein
MIGVATAGLSRCHVAVMLRFEVHGAAEARQQSGFQLAKFRGHQNLLGILAILVQRSASPLLPESQSESQRQGRPRFPWPLQAEGPAARGCMCHKAGVSS